MAATKTKSAPEPAAEAPAPESPAVKAARERYAAACAAEKASPDRSTAQATDAASVALYRALRGIGA